ncbi:MAG: 50S ribosomal protein L21, partial [Acidimicrobiia bacterium]|nr:50S ribosomal protein L21 [Acidimicrobiia bacterium]
MYAIIKSGGRQARVAEGDVLDIDRVTSDRVTGNGDLEFTPLMLVADDGTVITDPSKLGKATVKAKVVGETKGEKIHVFKFKNKTGYRRRIGHRQKFSTIEVTKITGVPKAKSSTSGKADAK